MILSAQVSRCKGSSCGGVNKSSSILIVKGFSIIMAKEFLHYSDQSLTMWVSFWSFSISTNNLCNSSEVDLWAEALRTHRICCTTDNLMNKSITGSERLTHLWSNCQQMHKHILCAAPAKQNEKSFFSSHCLALGTCVANDEGINMSYSWARNSGSFNRDYS